ncbi:uncharacterized protein LOC127104655 [Lathyrus oleraceus]|uniref:uncharacterized protein LOC127104655 n=1 Tax=Pisum sativum TaxID=3888 RepID=UPI0021CE2B35|nr:uncharacterized protein LOC127104655 [Pisum sativum]
MPRLPMEGDIDVGNQFKNKYDCVISIKKYHMKHCVYFKLTDSNKKRYVICRKNDTYTDPSIKVSVCISKIVSEYNFTPSYRKTWIARNKVIEQVYDNWENSYKEIPHYLLALKIFVPSTVVEMETLPIYTDEGTLVEGKHIFHDYFVHSNLTLEAMHITSLYIKLMELGNMTTKGWSFFIQNLRRHVAPQPDLCLILDMHASIESAYNNPNNGWHNPPSMHVYYTRHIV